MFDDEKIKLIRTMPEGDSIALIWVQVLCLAGKINDGGMVYMGQNLAYSDEMLATILDHPVSTVRIALSALAQFGMIDVTNDGKIDVLNWSKHQSTDKMAQVKEQNRIRQQRYYYRNQLRSMGYEEADIPDNIDLLKEMVEEPNVRLTLPNGVEVRSKKLDVRGKKLEERGKKKESNGRNSAKAKYADDSPYVILANRLYDHILNRNPEHKKPNVQKWADDIRKTVELDNRTTDDLAQVMDWSQSSDFWQTNILSTASLRKHYDTLKMQMLRDKPKVISTNFAQEAPRPEEETFTQEQIDEYEKATGEKWEG